MTKTFRILRQGDKYVVNVSVDTIETKGLDEMSLPDALDHVLCETIQTTLEEHTYAITIEYEV